MTAAGLGSLYICSNLLGMAGKVEKPPKEKEVPSALKEVKPKDAKPDPSKYKSKIDPKLVREAEARGNGWFAQTSRSKWTISTTITCTRWNGTRALPNSATRTRRRTRNGTATSPSS